MMPTITPEQIADLRRQYSVTTGGAYTAFDQEDSTWGVSTDQPLYDDPILCWFERSQDAVAFAAVHNALPALLDKLDALTARNAALEEAVSNALAWFQTGSGDKVYDGVRDALDSSLSQAAPDA